MEIDVDAEIDFGTLYNKFTDWLKLKKKRSKSKHEVSKELKKLGWEKKTEGIKVDDKNWTTSVFIIGLKLKN